MSTFQREAWYAAGLAEQVDRKLRRRVILDQPILLFRKQDDSPVAMIDRCPHRFAPLSRGKLIGDQVECGYHGLRFSEAGLCVHNPHSEALAPNMNIRNFPIIEKFGMIWIWMGEAANANPATLPDFHYMEDANTRTVHSYLHTDYRYDILIDNLLDLSHIEYLHLGSFSSGPAEHGTTKVDEVNNIVTVTRTQYNAPPLPNTLMVPTLENERVDMQFVIRWFPGQAIDFIHHVQKAGQGLNEPFTTRFSHVATPETGNSTHYFMSFTRNHDLDNPQMDSMIAVSQSKVIEMEDGPMLEAIDREMNGIDLLKMRPVILPVDIGAMRVRRVMKKLIEREAVSKTRL